MSDWTEDMMQEIEDDEEQIRLLTEANARLVGFAQELQARLEAYMAGGRESGGGHQPTGGEAADARNRTGKARGDGVSMPLPRYPRAAANPAAYDDRVILSQSLGMDVAVANPTVLTLRKPYYERQLRNCHERIRALEAERDALKARVNGLIRRYNLQKFEAREAILAEEPSLPEEC